MPPDSRPTLAQPDDDPYLWLEEIEGSAALAWVERQNADTLKRLDGPDLARDQAALQAIFDRPDNIPFVTRRGDRLYNYWRDAEHPRGLWRRTTMTEYRREAPQWETVLDLDALAADEGEDWVWGNAISLPGSHDRAILCLSRGGGDAVVLREFDLEAKVFVEDGFVLPEAKGWPCWLDRDHLLLESSYGEGMATDSGYARSIRLWRRGTAADAAGIIFEVPQESMSAFAWVDRSDGGERIVFGERLSFFEMTSWLGDRSGPKQRLDLPNDAWRDLYRGWLLVKPRQDWQFEGRRYPADSLLVTSLSGFLAGETDFTVLFEPSSKRSLGGFFWTGDRLVLSILDDLRPVYELLSFSDGAWQRDELPGLPEIGVATAWRLDSEEDESNGDLLLTSETPLAPKSLLLAEPGKAPAILKRAPSAFDPAGLTVSRHEARSLDGMAIPYVQIGPAESDGAAPVHLTAYGGFRISNLPYYRSSIGKLWLERGGTSVVANIRGGGEYGSAWHEAGRREGKIASHDDFAAVAADLVERGVTQPERIAAEGGSNGGILITNMLTRYPERFGALFCTIPLIDMRRYSKLLAGHSWIAEYGDPDNPDDWAYLQRYSAYHTAEPGRIYPPLLIATNRTDDRVHPGHGRKRAAKLQAMGYDARYFEMASGGHGYGKDNSETARFMALGYLFLRRAIGWGGGPAVS